MDFSRFFTSFRRTSAARGAGGRLGSTQSGGSTAPQKAVSSGSETRSRREVAGGKIAIVVGHNSVAQGAVRITDGRTEFDWNSDLAELIRAHDPKAIQIFYRQRGGGYSAEIDRVYAACDKWGADVTIELHFNSSADPRVSGGETLSSGSAASMRLAKLVRSRVRAVLKNEQRGVKVRRRDERGGRSLWQGKAPAVIAEPYFGSNAEECITADRHKDELAEAYYRAALEFLK